MKQLGDINIKCWTPGYGEINCLEYAPIDCINKYDWCPNEEGCITQPPEFEPSYNWYKIKLFDRPFRYEEGAINNNQADSPLQVSLSAIVMGNTYELTQLFNKMKAGNRCYMINFEDCNCLRWIVGSGTKHKPRFPLTFTSSRTISEQKTGYSTFRIAFEGIQPNHAYPYKI